MPYIKASVTQKLTRERQAELVNGLCAAIETIPGKDGGGLIVDLEDGKTMFYGGERQENMVFIDVKYYSNFAYHVKKDFTAAVFDVVGRVLGTAGDKMFLTINEEKILGNLNDERFQKLSYKYEDEQAELKQRIKHMKKVVAEEKAHELNCDGFLEIVRKYTDVTELAPEILREFIDKIVVHHREQLQGETVQKIELYYKMIGVVELPQMSKSEKENYIRCFSRTKKDQIA